MFSGIKNVSFIGFWFARLLSKIIPEQILIHALLYKKNILGVNLVTDKDLVGMALDHLNHIPPPEALKDAHTVH